MDDYLNRSRALVIVQQSRSPGFREVLALLDSIVKQICDDPYICDDDSRSLRLVHEGRGALKVVNRFKSEIALLEQAAQENTIA